MTGILIKQRKGHRHTDKGYVKMEAENETMQLQAKEWQRFSEARKKQGRILL